MRENDFTTFQCRIFFKKQAVPILENTNYWKNIPQYNSMENFEFLKPRLYSPCTETGPVVPPVEVPGPDLFGRSLLGTLGKLKMLKL